jgi:hypothetical protein
VCDKTGHALRTHSQIDRTRFAERRIQQDEVRKHVPVDASVQGRQESMTIHEE